MPPLSLSQVCDAEYVAARKLRPVSSPHEVGASVVTAPAPTRQGPGTLKRRGHNRLQWLQIQLFLEDMPKRGAA